MWLLSKKVSFRKKKIRIKGKNMDAFLADSPLKMTVGLMFRERLGKDECMLFSFPGDGLHPIWTRHMRFPIDIVWCDEMGRVVDFLSSAKPAGRLEFSGYYPEAASRYVVEFNAGFMKRNKLGKGDKLF